MLSYTPATLNLCENYGRQVPNRQLQGVLPQEEGRPRRRIRRKGGPRHRQRDRRRPRRCSLHRSRSPPQLLPRRLLLRRGPGGSVARTGLDRQRTFEDSRRDREGFDDPRRRTPLRPSRFRRPPQRGADHVRQTSRVGPEVHPGRRRRRHDRHHPHNPTIELLNPQHYGRPRPCRPFRSRPTTLSITRRSTFFSGDHQRCSSSQPKHAP